MVFRRSGRRAGAEKWMAVLVLLGLGVGLGLVEVADATERDGVEPELHQFDYLLGHWTIEMAMKDAEGIWKALDSTASMEAFFLDDGRTLQTIFRTPEGFFSTDLRTWNVAERKWEALFLNARRQRWHRFEAKWHGDEMILDVPGGYGGDAEYDVRIIHTSIEEQAFESKVFHSSDAGWTQVYAMTYRRTKEAPGS